MRRLVPSMSVDRLARHALVPRELRADGLRESIRLLEQVSPAPRADHERPVFVLAAGWRSGSTLVQRLLCSDPALLVWGEPFGEWVPVPRLAATLAGVHRYHHADQELGRVRGELKTAWIASLSPGLAPLHAAHRSFFDHVLARPAREAGYGRWGAKWVTVPGEHALYLRWLYPDARFVFVVRGLRSAYRSFTGRGWALTDAVRYGWRMSGVARFAAMWRHLAGSFVRTAGDLDCALVVRYEDVIAAPAPVIAALAQHTGLSPDDSALRVRLGSTRDKRRLSLWESAVIRLFEGELPQQLERLASRRPRE